MKAYIVFRKVKNPIFFNYERIELTKTELEPYLKNHLGELDNIDIFLKESRKSIDINIVFKGKEESYDSSKM